MSKTSLRRASRRLVLSLAALGTLAVPHATSAASCAVATADFCVCCPPSECRKEESYCPGGAGGLLLLKSAHPTCAVNPYDAARCKSGGVIASEQTSAVGVFVQGQRARLELSAEQLGDLTKQLEALRR